MNSNVELTLARMSHHFCDLQHKIEVSSLHRASAPEIPCGTLLSPGKNLVWGLCTSVPNVRHVSPDNIQCLDYSLLLVVQLIRLFRSTTWLSPCTQVFIPVLQAADVTFPYSSRRPPPHSCHCHRPTRRVGLLDARICTARRPCSTSLLHLVFALLALFTSTRPLVSRNGWTTSC